MLLFVENLKDSWVVCHSMIGDAIVSELLAYFLIPWTVSSTYK